MKKEEIIEIIHILEKSSKDWKVPVVTLVNLQEKDPFKVLLSTIISLRTKDEVTIESSKKLFEILDDPKNIDKIDEKDIENAIYPAGFYRDKSKRIKQICNILNQKHYGQVPKNLDELLELKGVGRKTANLVLAEGFGIPAICVDVHVHRISNRLGIVETNSTYETEIELKKILPEKYWNRYNPLMVAFGQYLCRPVSPFCSKCPIERKCPKIGVEKKR